MHAPPLPDVEALVYDEIKDLGGISVFAFDAAAQWPFVSEQVNVQIDVHASSKKRTHDRAYQARQMLLQLPMDDTNSVSRVDVLSGPIWLPEDDGAPRYVIRVGVSVRAFRKVK
jgi:hypothetical protein